MSASANLHHIAQQLGVVGGPAGDQSHARAARRRQSLEGRVEAAISLMLVLESRESDPCLGVGPAPEEPRLDDVVQLG